MAKHKKVETPSIVHEQKQMSVAAHVRSAAVRREHKKTLKGLCFLTLHQVAEQIQCCFILVSTSVKVYFPLICLAVIIPTKKKTKPQQEVSIRQVLQQNPGCFSDTKTKVRAVMFFASSRLLANFARQRIKCVPAGGS